MDQALNFNGPWGGPWKSGYDWTPHDTTMYISWKDKVDDTRTDALHCRDTATVEYNLQIVEAVEEAIWAAEIRMQDDDVDAAWLIEMHEQVNTTYELCQHIMQHVQ